MPCSFQGWWVISICPSRSASRPIKQPPNSVNDSHSTRAHHPHMRYCAVRAREYNAIIDALTVEPHFGMLAGPALLGGLRALGIQVRCHQHHRIFLHLSKPRTLALTDRSPARVPVLSRVMVLSDIFGAVRSWLSRAQNPSLGNIHPLATELPAHETSQTPSHTLRCHRGRGHSVALQHLTA